MSSPTDFDSVPLDIHNNKPASLPQRPLPIPLRFVDSSSSSDEEPDSIPSPTDSFSPSPARSRHVSMSGFLPCVSDPPARLDELDNSAYAVQPTPYESTADPFQAYSRIWDPNASGLQQVSTASNPSSTAAAGPTGPFTELAPRHVNNNNNYNYNFNISYPAAAATLSSKSLRAPPVPLSTRSSPRPPTMAFSSTPSDLHSNTVSPKDAFLDFDDVASRGDRQNLFMSQDPHHGYPVYSKDPSFAEPLHVNPPYPALTSTSPAVPLSSVQAPFDLPPNAVPWDVSTNIKLDDVVSDNEGLFSTSSIPPFSCTNSGLFNDDLDDTSPTQDPFDASFFKRRGSSRIPCSSSDSSSSRSSRAPSRDEAVPYRHSLAHSLTDAQEGQFTPPSASKENNNNDTSTDPDVMPVVAEKFDMYPHAPQVPHRQLSPPSREPTLSPPHKQSRSVSVASDDIPLSTSTRRRRTPTSRNSPAESSRRRKRQSPKVTSAIQHPLVERLKLEESADEQQYSEESPVVDSENPTENASEDASMSSSDQEFDIAESDEADEDEDYLGTPWPSKRRRARTGRGTGSGKQFDGIGSVTRQRMSKSKRADKISRSGRRKNSPEVAGAAIQCGYLDRATGKICQTMFQRPYDRNRHLDTVHKAARFGLDGQGEDHTGLPISRPSVPRCEECGGVFSRRDALIRHCRIRHRRTDL